MLVRLWNVCMRNQRKVKYSSKYLTDEMNLRLGSVSCVLKEYEFDIEHGLGLL